MRGPGAAGLLMLLAGPRWHDGVAHECEAATLKGGFDVKIEPRTSVVGHVEDTLRQRTVPLVRCRRVRREDAWLVAGEHEVLEPRMDA